MSQLTPGTLTALRASLPATASACVDAIVREVPEYENGFGGRMRENIESAVVQALATFLQAQGTPTPRQDPTGRREQISAPMGRGAYRLGRGEARAGRTTDALMAAYRVGARVAWSKFADIAVAENEPVANVASLAETTFMFIDELSAESLAGHTAALSERTRELSRRRDQLAVALAAGEPRPALERLAETAHWTPPSTLTALVLEGEPGPAVLRDVGPHALWTPSANGPAVALVPDLSPGRRPVVLSACDGGRAALGPDVPWAEASESLRRARRALRFARTTVDCDHLLPELALDADPLVSGLLAEGAVAPLADLSPGKRDVLIETLLAWLLHHGRREDVAEALHVHPQTVRYRMNTLRELYGGQLTDPRGALELTLGLLAHTELHDHEESA